MKATTKSFDNIDNNRLATAKQFFRVTVHLANLVKDEMNIPEKFFFRLRKQVGGVMGRHNPEGLTHGDVQKCLASTKLPTYLIANLQLVSLVGTEKVAPKKQPKAVKKPQPPRQPKAETQPQVVSTVRSKKDKISNFPQVDSRLTFLEEEVSRTKTDKVDVRLTFLEEEVSQMSNKIEDIKTTLEGLLSRF